MPWPKESRHVRGYDNEWYKLRARVLRRDRYLCQCKYCKAEGRTTVADQVDHIMPIAHARRKGWSRAQINDMSNLQAINRHCHARKTKEENASPNARAIGLDGFPIDDNTQDDK